MLGLGEIIGAIGFGRLIDRAGFRKTKLLCLAALITSVCCNWVFIVQFEYNLWFGAGICFLWGVQEAGIGVVL